MLERRGKALGSIDLHVASRVRERRIVLGISQPKLAAALGVTFQQVFKYEQGKSRIGAGRLYELGKVLGVPITFFFEGTADGLTPAVPLALGDHTDELGRREAIELFTAYRAISDPVLRRSLRELARALGSETNASTAKPSINQSRTRRSVRTIGAAPRRSDKKQTPLTRSGYRHSDQSIRRGPEHHRPNPHNDPSDPLHRCAPAALKTDPADDYSETVVSSDE